MRREITLASVAFRTGHAHLRRGDGFASWNFAERFLAFFERIFFDSSFKEPFSFSSWNCGWLELVDD